MRTSGRLPVRVSCALALLSVLLIPGFRPADGAPADPLPEARQVIVRGQQKLAPAILAALGGRAARANETVLVVLDVTPHTRDRIPEIRQALETLDDDLSLPRSWRFARLGDRASDPVNGPGALGARIAGWAGKDTEVRNTVRALRRSVRSFRDKGGAVVYLADWRFEDETDLEALARDLTARQLTFGVVGSEAAFGRAWNDGVLDPRQQMANGGMALEARADQKLYDERIGRRPFGPFEKDAPWHGGDTAYPHIPYRFAGGYWQTEFEPSALRFSQAGPDAKPGDLEDLLERMGSKRELFESSGGRKMVLPSSFGPHGLMRLAALRGGRYVLWSWNPKGRTTLTYDFARCNEFGPDLRSRSAVRKDAARRPLARALLAAWDAVGSKFNALAIHTAPLDRSGTRPQSIDLLERSATTLPTMWMRRDQHTEFLRKASHWKKAAEGGARRLHKALARVPAPRDAVDRRLAADAELLRHILDVLAFELGEAIQVAQRVPKDAWKDEETYPGIRPTPWIQRGDDPEAIRKSDVTLQDAARGAQVEAARASHLRRFRGTPFGVQVAANTVDTWVPSAGKKMKPMTGTPLLPGRTPGESESPPAPPSPKPPGGGSSGGGPSTGK